ncbi:minor tail protein [Actinomycetia phage DSL-LC01]|nr:minor tail protein [Actinomycetia phage DSL-LC01]
MSEIVDPQLQGVENAVVDRALTPLEAPVVTGLKLLGDISLGSLVLNTIDEDQTLWICTEIDGWWTHPDPDVPDIPRGWGDGSYDAKGKWLARQLTLSGTFIPRTLDNLQAARDKLIAATSLVRSGAWLIVQEDPPKSSYVRLSGRPEIETVNARGRVDFSIGLRAADPIKYEFRDDDPDGYTTVEVLAKNDSLGRDGRATVLNRGTAEVTAIFQVNAPITGPATIYNETTDELMIIVDPLRLSSSFSVSQKAIDNNVVTLTTSAPHDLLQDDPIVVAGVGAPYDGEYYVLDAPSNTTVLYELTAADATQSAASGTISRDADVIEIDTYKQEVAFNGLIEGTRSKVDTLTDWITLAPGLNTIRLIDEGQANSTAIMRLFYRSGWLG